MRERICGRPRSLCETQLDGVDAGGETSEDVDGSSAERFDSGGLHSCGWITIGLDLLERSDSDWKNWRTISVALSIGIDGFSPVDSLRCNVTDSSSNKST